MLGTRQCGQALDWTGLDASDLVNLRVVSKQILRLQDKTLPSLTEYHTASRCKFGSKLNSLTLQFSKIAVT